MWGPLFLQHRVNEHWSAKKFQAASTAQNQFTKRPIRSTCHHTHRHLGRLGHSCSWRLCRHPRRHCIALCRHRRRRRCRASLIRCWLLRLGTRGGRPGVAARVGARGRLPRRLLRQDGRQLRQVRLQQRAARALPCMRFGRRGSGQERSQQRGRPERLQLHSHRCLPLCRG